MGKENHTQGKNELQRKTKQTGRDSKHLSLLVFAELPPELHLKKDITFSSTGSVRLHRQIHPSLELITQLLHISVLTQMSPREHPNSDFLMWFFACLDSEAAEKSIYTINLKSFNYTTTDQLGGLYLLRIGIWLPYYIDKQMTPM